MAAKGRLWERRAMAMVVLVLTLLVLKSRTLTRSARAGMAARKSTIMSIRRFNVSVFVVFG